MCRKYKQERGNSPFLGTGTHAQESCLNSQNPSKLVTYRCWRTTCTGAIEGRREMNNQVSLETAVCAEHQMLLAECQRALEIWNEHRAEFCQFRFMRREAGDELLRLQAKYARAYTVLQNHERNCSLCQLASRMEGRNPENRPDAFSDNAMYT